jgi:hypothetical protein
MKVYMEIYRSSTQTAVFWGIYNAVTGCLCAYFHTEEEAAAVLKEMNCDTN